jgi:hypothetical protein
MQTRHLHRAATLAGLIGFALGVASAASAAELYAPLGIPGAGIGFAQPLGPSFGLRLDAMTLGERDRDRTESGISYHARYKLTRGALLADWFPFAGGFRLTGGATLNRYSLNLDASGAGGTLTIGHRTYTTTAADGLNVDIKFPTTTPYLGLGWGHHVGAGWRFAADFGAAIGRATLSATARGPLAAQPDIQANIDQELSDLRDGVGRIRAIPQLSVSLGYSF